MSCDSTSDANDKLRSVYLEGLRLVDIPRANALEHVVGVSIEVQVVSEGHPNGLHGIVGTTMLLIAAHVLQRLEWRSQLISAARTHSHCI